MQDIFIDLLSLANTFWKGLDEKQAAENRMLLIGPYVDKLCQITKSASARGTKAHAQEDKPSEEEQPRETETPADTAEPAEPTAPTDPTASTGPEEPGEGTT
jgi:hypothetical protein